MDKVTDHKSAYSYLYPHIVPFDTRMLDVGQGHQLYVEQCGNPEGVPVVVLHGGPGGGCSPYMRRFFDPQAYRIILFDQRGCGKSRPASEVSNNTTWHLVGDIERIREELGIDRWIVFGGSWGATLAVTYAQTHPLRPLHLVLRGVFLAQQYELDWFYGGGAGQFWPELWRVFCDAIPDEEHDDLIAAYHRRLFSGDYATEVKFGKIWARWENALASFGSNGQVGESSPDYARTFARLENHYFHAGAFLEEDGQLIRDADKMADIPGTIVQGRYDMICPPKTAYLLHRHWPQSDLKMIAASGHALSEPEITKALVAAMNDLRERHLAA